MLTRKFKNEEVDCTIGTKPFEGTAFNGPA